MITSLICFATALAWGTPVEPDSEVESDSTSSPPKIPFSLPTKANEKEQSTALRPKFAAQLAMENLTLSSISSNGDLSPLVAYAGNFGLGLQMWVGSESLKYGEWANFRSSSVPLFSVLLGVRMQLENDGLDWQRIGGYMAFMTYRPIHVSRFKTPGLHDSFCGNHGGMMIVSSRRSMSSDLQQWNIELRSNYALFSRAALLLHMDFGLANSQMDWRMAMGTGLAFDL